MKSARITVLAMGVAWLSGCGGSSQALGTATSIIVLATDTVWAEIGEDVHRALEPRIYTTRSERTFEVTHVPPGDPRWTELREFRQVVAIGAADDAWVQPIIEQAESGTGVVTARDVWARNQLATAIVLPSSDAAEAALPHLERVGSVIDSLFRIYAVQRMYTSGADSALSESLRDLHGFSILLPNVYSPVTRVGGNMVLYQNNTVVGGDLARSVLAAWREGATTPTADAATAWRDTIAAQVYNPTQHTLRDSLNVSAVSVQGAEAIEVQGAWEGTDPAWPMGGLFITRMVSCQAQNRTYLLDTWLYAPGPRRSKYEYMIQLQTILSTFECASQ